MRSLNSGNSPIHIFGIFVVLFSMLCLNTSICVASSFWDDKREIIAGNLYDDLIKLQNEAKNGLGVDRCIAEMVLGMAYAMGEGVRRDYTEAARWWQKSAEHCSLFDPPYYLGRAYAFGEGVPVNLVQASKWWRIAATVAKDDDDRELAVGMIGRVSALMTRTQILEAEKLATEWRSRFREGSPDSAKRGNSPSKTVKPAAKLTRGTGFFVSHDGLILTCHHIIREAKAIKVRLGDGHVEEGKFIRGSQSVDLALLKIDFASKNHLPLATDVSTKLGDRVFTVGYPAVDLLGSDPKFTEGAISSLTGPGNDLAFMQITVPVQPGNSGGPLVNNQGEVVGVITATASVKEFYKSTGTLPQNVNWAVNASFARGLLDADVPSHALAMSREEAIEKARMAVCLIETLK